MEEGNRVVALVDVDDTLINGAGLLNLSLIDVLRSANLESIWLLTSYSLHWNTLPNTGKNALRIDVIRRLKRFGIKVETVVTSVIPYLPLDVRQTYYFETIQPIERLCREKWLQFPQKEKIEAILSNYTEVSQMEITLINANIVNEIQDLKGGKQHMIEYSITSVPEGTGLVFFDDKPEVNKVTKHISQAQICQEKNIKLKEHPVHFKYLDEGYKVYEESIAQVSGRPLPTPSPLVKKAAKVIMTVVFVEEDLLFEEKDHLNPRLASLCRQSIGVVIFTSHDVTEDDTNALSMKLTNYQITLLDVVKIDLYNTNLAALEVFAEAAGRLENRYPTDPLHFMVLVRSSDFANILKVDYPNDPAIQAVVITDQTEENLCAMHLLHLYNHELRLLDYLIRYHPTLKAVVENFTNEIEKLRKSDIEKFPLEFSNRVVEELRSFLFDPHNGSLLNIMKSAMVSERKFPGTLHGDVNKIKKQEKKFFKHVQELVKALDHITMVL